MPYVVCPVCDRETIRIDWKRDFDGDIHHRRHWEYPDITDQDCDCKLSAEQIDAILKAEEKDGPPYDEP